MSYVSGVLPVGTAPVPFVVPQQRGALIANAGTAVLWVGGSAVTPGQGVPLAVNGAPIWIYGSPIVGSGFSDSVYAVQTGTAGGSIAWMGS